MGSSAHTPPEGIPTGTLFLPTLRPHLKNHVAWQPSPFLSLTSSQDHAARLARWKANSGTKKVGIAIVGFTWNVRSAKDLCDQTSTLEEGTLWEHDNPKGWTQEHEGLIMGEILAHGVLDVLWVQPIQSFEAIRTALARMVRKCKEAWDEEQDHLVDLAIHEGELALEKAYYAWCEEQYHLVETGSSP